MNAPDDHERLCRLAYERYSEGDFDCSEVRLQKMVWVVDRVDDGQVGRILAAASHARGTISTFSRDTPTFSSPLAEADGCGHTAVWLSPNNDLSGLTLLPIAKREGATVLRR